MHSKAPSVTVGGETRRDFIKKAGMAAVVTGTGMLRLPASASDRGESMAIVLDPASTVVKEKPVQWAAEYLRDCLVVRGVAAQVQTGFEQLPPSQPCIVVSNHNSNLTNQILGAAGISVSEAAESLALARGRIEQRPVLLASGSDARGLVYALLELADRVSFAANPLDELQSVRPVSEHPANQVRSVARAFVSNVEDTKWFRDRGFWSRYLTMLATQRFNRFSLTFGIGYDFTTNISDCYFHFAYPFLLGVPGYDVRAVPLANSERDQNLELLKFISEETVRRGLHFQLGLWTHAYHWTRSPKANYTIEGLTPDTQAPYCRDALRTLLAACPAISGITFRVHGESGVPEGHYGLWKTIFDGVAKCGRRVEIDMHAKGMDQQMIDVALGTGMPVKLSPKYWAEHMGLPYMQGAIRPQERPRPDASNTGFFSRSSGSRSFLRYGYGDLLTENRPYGVLHRMWPGTQRVLLWGNPEIAAAYGRVSSFCGSVGMELFEPLFFKGRKGSGLPGGRNAYADTSLRPDYDFEKFNYTYRLWGRNLYNPDGDPDGWRRLLRKQFRHGVEIVEDSLASAGRILPLVTTAHCPSAANNNYWPEMYTAIATVDASRPNPYFDTPVPKRLGTVTPLDPEFFLGIDEFADELIKGERGGKYSPAWVARQLDEAAERAVIQIRRAKARVHNHEGAEFRRLALDVTIQSGLGRFYASKFRSGVLYSLYLRSHYRPALEESLKTNRAARKTWAALADTAKNVYRDDVTYGPEYYQRGHWLDRLKAMDADIADMEALLKKGSDSDETASKTDPKAIKQAMRAVMTKADLDEHPTITELHTPPSSFRRGQPLPIVARVPKDRKLAMVSGLRLHYRHVNQGEIWKTMDMEASNTEHRAVIAADYTDSPFPMQYYFQIRTQSGGAWLHPGLQPGWHGQPYFYVRQA